MKSSPKKALIICLIVVISRYLLFEQVTGKGFTTDHLLKTSDSLNFLQE